MNFRDAKVMVDWWQGRIGVRGKHYHVWYNSKDRHLGQTSSLPCFDPRSDRHNASTQSFVTGIMKGKRMHEHCEQLLHAIMVIGSCSRVLGILHRGNHRQVEDRIMQTSFQTVFLLTLARQTARYSLVKTVGSLDRSL